MHDAEDIEGSGKPVSSSVHGLGLAILVIQTGCVSLFVIFAALFVGLWLDDWLGGAGLCVVGAVLISIPVSLYMMVRVALGIANRRRILVVEAVPNDSPDRKEDVS